MIIIQKHLGVYSSIVEMNQIIMDYGLFKFKSKFLDNTNNEGIINAKIPVSLKYSSNFWVTLEILN